MSDRAPDKKTITQWLSEARGQISEIGWTAFKSGDWLLPVVHRVFKADYTGTSADDLRRKYPRKDNAAIIRKLTTVACKQAALLGAITGAAVAFDEIVALIVAVPAGGLNLPAQITLAAGALGAEAIVLIKIQLRLIANIAHILDVPLNPDDPEDILLILEFAFGGAGAEAFGKAGAKAAGHVTKSFVRAKVGGTTLAGLKKWGSKIGLKILQRSIIKYAVPVVSSIVGAAWNYATTAKIGGIATQHFQQAKRERAPKRRRVASPRKKKPKVRAKQSGKSNTRKNHSRRASPKSSNPPPGNFS